MNAHLGIARAWRFAAGAAGWSGRAAVAAALFLMAGCASYAPAPIVPAESAAALEARSLDDAKLGRLIAALDPEGAAAPGWDLSKLTLAALYFHPDLDVARSRLASSEAGLITAGERPNPVLRVVPTKHTTILDPSSWTVGASLDVIIETAGKRGHRVAAAEDLTAAARHDLATAAWQARGRVRGALLTLWSAESRRALIENRRALQEQLVGLLSRRFAAGEASALDLARERIALNEASLALRRADGERAQALAALAAAIGLPAQALEHAPLSLAGFDHAPDLAPDIASGTLRRHALTERSDIQALLAEYAASEARLQLEVARQYPDLVLGPGYTFDQGDNQYTVGLAAELPIFNQHQGPIAEAAAKRREAAARFTRLQAQIIAEIDGAAAAYRAAAATLATADTLRQDETARGQQIERSFRAGGVDRPTLVTAEIELADADLSRFAAVADQRRAIERLEDALQTPLFDPGAALLLPQAVAGAPSS